MAARRLLIVMVVLLVLSSLAAALVPPPPERGSTSSTTATTTTTTTSTLPPTGGQERKILLSASKPREAPVQVEAGDQLAITVVSLRFVEVSIPEYGLLENATEGSPARFDVIVDEEGTFAVRTLEPARTIAEIEAASPSARSGER